MQQVGFSSHDYIEMHSQQNLKIRGHYFVCVTIILLFGISLYSYIRSVCGCYILHPVVCITQAAKFITYCQLHIHCFSEGVSHFTFPIVRDMFNPLNAELNPICYLLALLGAHHFLHVSRIRVKSLTLTLLMSYIYIYIYMEHLFLMFLDHTPRRTTVGRTTLDE